MENELRKVLSTKVGMMLAQKPSVESEPECPECGEKMVVPVSYHTFTLPDFLCKTCFHCYDVKYGSKK